MEKIEGDFQTNQEFQAGLELFRKVLAGAGTANNFYLRLSASQTTENITLRTSSTLGADTTGNTAMYVHKGGQTDVDVDSFDFNGVTKNTARTLRITAADSSTGNYSKAKIAATLLHEFLVHGVPFKTVFDSIRTSTDSDEMALLWKKSRSSDNSPDHQHALFGAGQTAELHEVLMALQNPKAISISNKDAADTLKELERDIAYHKEQFPL